MKTPDYMNYSRYKNNKKKEEEPQKGLLIGLTTFFAMLLFFTLIAKALSPNVDVNIGEDEEIEAKESGLGVKGFVDDRLKMIQAEDKSSTAIQQNTEAKNTTQVEDPSVEEYSTDLDEKVVLPNSGKKETKTEAPITLTPAAAPRPSSAKPLSSAASARPTKVYVGYYNTVDQAKVAQGILIDSGLNITPFIKDIGGTYTLQVGSYSNREKATVLSNELLRNNFPARVVQE